MIDTTESRQHFGAIPLAVERPFRPLEFTDRLVTVHRDEQSISQFFGLLQITDMAGM